MLMSFNMLNWIYAEDQVRATHYAIESFDPVSSLIFDKNILTNVIQRNKLIACIVSLEIDEN